MGYSEIFALIDSNLASGTKITAAKHREVEHALLDFIQSSIFQIGDIKEVDCSNAYMSANFDVTGLGINERVGWAICNGQNGTQNRGGRVGVGFGLAPFSVIGGLGGEREHTLVESEIPPLPAFPKAIADNDRGTLSSNFTLDVNTNFGGGQPHNNMQPYIISLFIQKL